ncbi:MAG: DUF115 domain-containing protein [Leptospirales bacterium]|nr:DUF115 domain-containing protein [Leptospirales bacterium]
MVNQQEIFLKLNEGMLEEKGYAFKNNLKKNLSLIKKYGGLESVVNSFKNKHVLVIGAGPSLEKKYETLRILMSNYNILLIAADIALRPLYENGIKPQFVITCETTPNDFFSGIKTDNIHLLAFSCSSNTNLRKWKGNISFYNWMINSQFYDNLWREAGEYLGFVATGSIVTTQAVSLALGCGIASLLLVGNDIGFFDKFYAAGVISSEKIFFSSKRLKTHTTIDMNRGRSARDYEILREGELFYTNNQFLAAKMWLEQLFQSAPYPVADCSKPGCSSGVINKIDINEYLAIFNNKGGMG